MFFADYGAGQAVGTICILGALGTQTVRVGYEALALPCPEFVPPAYAPPLSLHKLSKLY